MNTIYALVEVDTGTKFYIGQTHREPHIRLSEHRYGARVCNDSSENKYKYASALDYCGTLWDMVILTQIETEKDTYSMEDTEDFYVCKYRDQPLQNMCAGWGQPWMNATYDSIDEMLAAKEKYLLQQKHKEARVKKQQQFDADKMLFSFEKPQEKFVSAAFLRLKQRTQIKRDK